MTWTLQYYFSGIFFVMPCIETYQKVDLRTITLGVPPQEVSNVVIGIFIIPSGKNSRF